MSRNPHEPRRREHLLARHYRAITIALGLFMLLSAVVAARRADYWTALTSLAVIPVWVLQVWWPWRPNGTSRVAYERWMSRTIKTSGSERAKPT